MSLLLSLCHWAVNDTFIPITLTFKHLSLHAMNYIFTPTNTHTLRTVSRCVNEVQLFYYRCFLFALLHLASSCLINYLLLLSFFPFSFPLLHGSISHFLLFLRLFLVSFYGHTFVSQQVKLSGSKVTACKHADIDTRRSRTACAECVYVGEYFSWKPIPASRNPVSPCLRGRARTSEWSPLSLPISHSLSLSLSSRLSSSPLRLNGSGSGLVNKQTPVKC